MESLMQWFKLCSDTTRLRLLMVLRERSACVCQLCGLLSLPQPKVSKHLAKLKAAGYVKDERRDKYIYYSIYLPSDLFKMFLSDIAAHREEVAILKQDYKRLSTFNFDACVFNDVQGGNR